MIEVDTLAQAIDESQCSGPVGLEDMTWSLSTASKALVDIAISLRTLAGRPLPETTPRQEAIAGKIREGITDPEAMAAGFCQIRPDSNYVKTITRRMLSDGVSDPTPSPPECGQARKTRRRGQRRANNGKRGGSMSDRIIPMHTLACDWPGCDEVASDDMYSAWESYNSALIMFADPGNDGEWLHTEDGKDYCPKHWHWDDEHGRVPGPDPKGEA